MKKVKLDLRVQLNRDESTDQAMVRAVTKPECLSASVLTICRNIDHDRITEIVAGIIKDRPAKPAVPSGVVPTIQQREQGGDELSQTRINPPAFPPAAQWHLLPLDECPFPAPVP